MTIHAVEGQSSLGFGDYIKLNRPIQRFSFCCLCADFVKQTEALSEVFKVPGPIHSGKNGDADQKANYPWLFSSVKKVCLTPLFRLHSSCSVVCTVSTPALRAD